jgi:hypothetical protein
MLEDTSNWHRVHLYTCSLPRTSTAAELVWYSRLPCTDLSYVYFGVSLILERSMYFKIWWVMMFMDTAGGSTTTFWGPRQITS